MRFSISDAYKTFHLGCRFASTLRQVYIISRVITERGYTYGFHRLDILVLCVYSVSTENRIWNCHYKL